MLLPLLLAVLLLLLLPLSAAGLSLGHFLMFRAKSALTPATPTAHVDAGLQVQVFDSHWSMAGVMLPYGP
jgi:hypothetical protein